METGSSDPIGSFSLFLPGQVGPSLLLYCGFCYCYFCNPTYSQFNWRLYATETAYMLFFRPGLSSDMASHQTRPLTCETMPLVRPCLSSDHAARENHASRQTMPLGRLCLSPDHASHQTMPLVKPCLSSDHASRQTMPLLRPCLTSDHARRSFKF